MVKLHFVVAHWLMTTLADLTVTADDFEHDLTRDRAGVRAYVFGLGERLRYEEDRAQVPKHPARRLRQNLRYCFGIVVGLVIGHHPPKDPPPLGIKRLIVGEATRAERRPEVLVVTLRL